MQPSYATVTKMIADGLKTHMVFGTIMYFDRHEVDDYLSSK
ncbi:hypothetical protein [Nicoliella spurrieriana]|nr:hypothetical protein [Nicoliella spurrieriana]